VLSEHSLARELNCRQQRQFGLPGSAHSIVHIVMLCTGRP